MLSNYNKRKKKGLKEKEGERREVPLGLVNQREPVQTLRKPMGAHTQMPSPESAARGGGGGFWRKTLSDLGHGGSSEHRQTDGSTVQINHKTEYIQYK